MTRNQLCEFLGCSEPPGPPFEVTSVTEDSRRVVPGALFVAIRGEHADGHDHAAQAVTAGAVVIAGARRGTQQMAGVPYLAIEEPRRLAGRLAHALAGYPSRAMTVVGITGTNGKSSTAFLTQAVLRHAGHACANFGTLGYEIAGHCLPAAHTTPFAEELAHIFKKANDAGLSHVVMEVSSHALEQQRVAGIEFDVAAFTNLTQDHLDYHHDMDNYRQAKLQLFHELTGAGRFTVVNADDPSAQAFIAASKVPCHSFGRAGQCRALRIRTSMGSTQFHLLTPWGEAEVALKLLGRHNTSNALCAAAICGGMGMPVDRIAEGLAALQSVPGRFEPVDAGQDFFVIVDYAHTADGLRNVLQAARELTKGRVITVFGCGGDRDKGKRPKMGAVAAKLSDFAILTSDNPRTEDPHRIILDVEVGLQRAGKRKKDDYLVIERRQDAIRQAISMARPADLVMIAGKGHEDYQILGTNRIHFDDREVARAALGGH